MINLELEPKTIELATDVLKVIEQVEPIRRLVIESTKRVEKFQIIRASPRSIFFKVLYESGKSIPGLEGSFTTPELAYKALIRYLANTKQTKQSVYKDRWGDKEIPDIKFKKPRKKKVTDASSQSISTNSD